MATTHISQAEAARNFDALIARVRAGEELIIDGDEQPSVMILRLNLPRRSVSESIAIADAYAEEQGSAPTMDADFAADLEAIIAARKPRDLSAWD